MILRPTAGTIEAFGKNAAVDRAEISKDTNFAAVYAHMPLNLTVRQNLRIFGLLYGVKGLEDRISALLHQFELERFADSKAGLLSSGELSRLSLAKAVINNPRLLLLDEPTASLDPDTADWVRGRLERYCRERHATVLLASHNMAEVERLCERVIMMKRGRIEDDDTPERLIARYGRNTLEEVFLDIARGRTDAREAAQ